MTKRKADMLRVAEALGLKPEAGETTSVLAERCAERAAELVDVVGKLQAERKSKASGQTPADPEAEPADRAPRPRRRKSEKAAQAS